MKKVIAFLSLCLFTASSLIAQQGIIEYEQTVKIEIPQEVKDRMARSGMQFNIPESTSFNQILTFNENASVFKFKPKEESEEDEFAGRGRGGRGFRMRMMGGGRGGQNNIFYKDMNKAQKIEQKDLMGKLFLISDKVDDFKWKVSGKPMEIMGYMCMEAETIHKEDTLKAYFAPQIAVSNGPGIYGNLPGMILMVDINDGQRVIKATKIDLEAEIEAFDAPSKGKKVTQEEYDEIQAAKIKEMREMYGEGRARMISM